MASINTINTTNNTANNNQMDAPASPDIPLARSNSDLEMQNLSKLRSKEVVPRAYNIGAEVELVTTQLGQKKAAMSWHKMLFLGTLAGLFIVFGGAFALTVAGGISVDTRKAYPMLPKLLVGLTFPVCLFLIIIFGGELFTGNTMVLVIALLERRITVKRLLLNWSLIFISNAVGCVLGAYLFCYLTELFGHEPFLSYVVGIAEAKSSLGWGVAFLRAIPANALVCLGVFMGLSARDVTGKIIGMGFPVTMFATVGFEHCIANMFFIPLGMMYGANVTVGRFISHNLIPVTLGNIVGGSLLVGCSEYYLFHWHKEGQIVQHGLRSHADCISNEDNKKVAV